MIGSMRKINKLIPELRFPEFVNDGEWEERTVGDLYDFHVTNSFSREYLNYEDGVVKNIHYGDIHTKFNTHFDIVKEQVPYINSNVPIDKIKDESYCREGDVIFADASEDLNDIGKCIEIINLNFEKVVSGLHTLIARQKGSLLIIGFGGFLFKTFGVRKQIQKEAQGAKVLGISVRRISDVIISYPHNHKEQYKITFCLASLDDVIVFHNQKLEALKDHKKGLMQILFPQEGEKVPKLRFPEFAEDGEWVEKNLDGICKLVRGPFGGSLKKEIFVKDGYAVYEQSHAIYGDFNSFRYYIDDKKYSELKRFSVKNGDLIMSCSGTMGKFALIPQNYKVGVINQALLKLTIKKGFNNKFVKMTLESENNQNKLLSQSAGGAIKNVVSVSQIKELELLIPSIEEQQKIASCFSSLDHIITAQTEQIEQLKLYKKGLMQGLFPKI